MMQIGIFTEDDRLEKLSDDQTEYQINDQMSFMRFLGLSLGDKVPDAKTIWLFRDTLTQANVIENLFCLFTRQLEQQGIITHTGTVVDATFVDTPRQRNTREENKAIKSGNIPEEWKENTPKTAHKLSQKDTDARWTIKGGKKHYGYKDSSMKSLALFFISSIKSCLFAYSCIVHLLKK